MHIKRKNYTTGFLKGYYLLAVVSQSDTVSAFASVFVDEDPTPNAMYEIKELI